MARTEKPSAKSRVEAVLFSVGQRITIDNLCRLCRIKKEEAIDALQELKKEYDEKQSSLMLVEDGDNWKFTVRDYLISVVRKIVTETELTKSVMETLAVIAFKYPILQSDLIRIRTNKAYDHLVELEKTGYITRQKHGRTNLIKLTEKFFKYFDLTEEKLKDQFKDFASIARAIEEKEVEIENIKEDQRQKAQNLKEQDEKIKQQIDSLDDDTSKIDLQTYDAQQKKEPTTNAEEKKLGDLEIVDVQTTNEEEKDNLKDADQETEKLDTKEEIKEKNEPSVKEEKEKNIQEKQETKEQDSKEDKETDLETDKVEDETEEDTEEETNTFKGKNSQGIKLTEDMEKAVDKKVSNLLNQDKNQEQSKND